MAFFTPLMCDGEQWRPRCDSSGTIINDEKLGDQKLNNQHPITK